MPEKGILIRTYFARDQVPDCPDVTHAKNKLSLWDKYFMHRHTIIGRVLGAWNEFDIILEFKFISSQGKWGFISFYV